MPPKHRLAFGANATWSALGIDLNDLSNKRARSGSSASSSVTSIPASLPDLDAMEGVEATSAIETTDDIPFELQAPPSTPTPATPTPTQSTFTFGATPAPPSTPQPSTSAFDTAITPTFNSRDIPAIPAPGSPIAVQLNSASTPITKSLWTLCNVSFGELYYLDFQLPFFHPDLFFDLTQNPEMWVRMLERSPHTDEPENPQYYINICLDRMLAMTGNYSPLLVCMMFATIYTHTDEMWGFWRMLYLRAYDHIKFWDDSGKEYRYLGRIWLENGALRSCWDYQLIEYLEKERYTRPWVYFEVTFDHGLKFLDMEKGEKLMREETFEDNWSVELLRHEM